ncbi:MAG: nucleoside 2-deoxyribosyltransferase [Actinomycetaceae bacterium]|nr:nucleoside 2-deoxyribosyltransferase [Actinomycetaceae bacterium]MDY6082278.1 nucleoside 2-deoxyribosyltransferase [Actinomycetaceae bacterium]
MFVYIAGDIMSSGSQFELSNIESIVAELGLDYYSPIKNKGINDKKNVTVEENNKLAEKIVMEDTERLRRADIVIFNIKEYAIGTLVEIGQVLDMVEHGEEKHCIFLYDDIRRTTLPEIGDRRSWSVNQYLYGAVLKLTDGRGFVELAEVRDELEKIVAQH